MRRIRWRPFSHLIGFVVLAGALGGAASPASAAGDCDAPHPGREASAPAPASATLCLLNDQRAAHGLRPLRHDERLSRAAQRHARDLATNDYFSHVSQSGATVSDRIEQTGWMRGRSRWTVAENLAWGAGSLGDPAAIVAAWMDSPGHRDNILGDDFRRVGIGIEDGTPIADVATGVTYTVNFGS